MTGEFIVNILKITLSVSDDAVHTLSTDITNNDSEKYPEECDDKHNYD